MLLKKIIMLLLIMPIAALVVAGLTIIWAMIVQWLFKVIFGAYMKYVELYDFEGLIWEEGAE